MAKKHFKAPKNFSGKVVTTKSHFGSHSEMMIDRSKYNNIQVNDNQVVCKDDEGYYITDLNRIDNGLADPNRYANPTSRLDAALDLS